MATESKPRSASGMWEVGKVLDSKVPEGDIQQVWNDYKFDMKLVAPGKNRRTHNIIMVGTGLAGASAAASLGEEGYHVDAFFYQDSARRAHSIAAQGGINAAKNYRNDGDSHLPALLRHRQGRRLPRRASRTSTAWPRTR